MLSTSDAPGNGLCRPPVFLFGTLCHKVNALRFAKENVSVELSIEGENLKLEIADDGDGFPAELLKNGIQPFRKGTEEAEHLGMGLYICDLLCRKHGGTLKIANTDIGAVASAILKIS